VSDHATPNLPSRDFTVTSEFYQRLGFVEGWRDDGWMILTRNGAQLEFFPDPDHNPATSSFGSCMRLDDLAGFYAVCKGAGVSETCWGAPRIQPPKLEESGLTIGALIDPDGSLIRLIQN
jgi:catechol 2,3-dioxygenase-like lactoylglutathione lyase family enzyme